MPQSLEFTLPQLATLLALVTLAASILSLAVAVALSRRARRLAQRIALPRAAFPATPDGFARRRADDLRDRVHSDTLRELRVRGPFRDGTFTLQHAGQPATLRAANARELLLDERGLAFSSREG